MAQTRLSKFEFYIADPATGLPVQGATIEIRRQGATVRSGGTNTFTIENAGAIRHSSEAGAPAADSVQVFLPSGGVRDLSVRTVTALSASSITVGGPGFGSVTDDDRLSPSTNLPTIYEDSEGTEIKTTPLQTDTNGFAYCWARLTVCDALVERSPGGGTSDIRLLIDQMGQGGSIEVLNQFSGASGTFKGIDTLRAMAVGDRHLAGLVQGVEKWWFDRDGKLTLGGGLDVAGAASFPGGITGNLTFAGTVTVQDVLTASKNAAGALVVSGAAASLQVSGANGIVDVSGASGIIQQTGVTGKIIANRLWLNKGTAHVAGDWALSAGWGSTASVSVIAGANDSAGLVSFTANGAGIGANPTVTLTFKDGTWGAGIIGLATRGESSAPITATWTVQAAGATTITWMFVGTPVGGSTYAIQYLHLRKN